MLYGLEKVVLTKGEEAWLEAAELEMMTFSWSNENVKRIRNEDIKVTTWIRQFGHFNGSM